MSEAITDDEESLRKQAAVIRDKITRIEDKRRFEESVALQGKCFRYRNSYSCPKDDSERWWLYQRVLRVTKDGWLVVFRFQTDQYGKTEIEPEHRSMSSLGEPITAKQFQYAWKVAVARINQKAREAKAVV